MYNTTNMFLEWPKVGNYNLSTLTNTLQNVTEHQNNSYNSVTGNLKNYKVGVYESGVSLKGSICKYFNGDNLHTLSRSGMQRAIEQMSDELHLPIDRAKVTQVDLATHFIMKHDAKEYYKYLGAKRYFNRLQATNDTLYYNTKARQLIFYNKLKEAINKAMEVPIIFENKNVLRYEIRHKGRLNNQFQLPEVTALTLYDEQFYIRLIDVWAKEYFNIQKINRLKLDKMDTIKTPTDAKNIIFGLLLNKAGQNEIENIIADMKLQKVYSDRKYYSRLKKDLIKLANQTEISEQSELITELDQNIKSIKMNYR